MVIHLFSFIYILNEVKFKLIFLYISDMKFHGHYFNIDKGYLTNRKGPVYKWRKFNLCS